MPNSSPKRNFRYPNKGKSNNWKQTSEKSPFKRTESEIDESLIKTARWMIKNQGCLTRKVAAQILEIYLSDNERYVQYQVLEQVGT